MDRQKKLPYVSVGMVVINVIVFVVCRFTGDLLYDAGELSLWGIFVRKEYARVLWAMFLHANDMHLFNNMLVLFFLGSMLEEKIGSVRFGVVYMISGIVGNLASLLSKYLSMNMAASLGASGAVFGLDGLLLALVLWDRRRLANVTVSRVLLMIGLSLYSGFTGTNIDNAAHVGGLVAGFLSGLLLCLIEKLRQRNHTRDAGIE